MNITLKAVRAIKTFIFSLAVALLWQMLFFGCGDNCAHRSCDSDCIITTTRTSSLQRSSRSYRDKIDSVLLDLEVNGFSKERRIIDSLETYVNSNYVIYPLNVRAQTYANLLANVQQNCIRGTDVISSLALNMATENYRYHIGNRTLLSSEIVNLKRQILDLQIQLSDSASIRLPGKRPDGSDAFQVEAISSTPYMSEVNYETVEVAIGSVSDRKNNQVYIIKKIPSNVFLFGKPLNLGDTLNFPNDNYLFFLRQ